MSNHTPGPWGVDSHTAHVNQISTGLPLAALQWPSYDRSEEKTKANARLIASAPCLLEAVKLLMAIIGPKDSETWANDDEIDAAWEAGESAIAKATGKDTP